MWLSYPENIPKIKSAYFTLERLSGKRKKVGIKLWNGDDFVQLPNAPLTTTGEITGFERIPAPYGMAKSTDDRFWNVLSEKEPERNNLYYVTIQKPLSFFVAKVDGIFAFYDANGNWVAEIEDGWKITAWYPIPRIV